MNNIRATETATGILPTSRHPSQTANGITPNIGATESVDILTGWKKAGKKEEEDKLNYELDWDFVQGMAERMSLNKGKYSPYNWKQPVDVQKLNNALARHFMAVQQEQYSDGQDWGHYYALAVNAMMIVYQLKTYLQDEKSGI